MEEIEPPVFDDLDNPRDRRPRRVTDDHRTIRWIREILENEQVPEGQRPDLARAFYDDWVLVQSDQYAAWLERCRDRARQAAAGDSEPPPAPMGEAEGGASTGG